MKKRFLFLILLTSQLCFASSNINNNQATNANIDISKDVTNSIFYNPNNDDATRFAIALAQVKRFYVEEKSEKDIFANALRGLLSGLDPHSIYLDEEDLAEFRAQAEGKFVGIGVEITQEGGVIKVVSPLDGSPAQKAGILAGDYIIAVNGAPILDMPINKVMKLLRGKPNTNVTLTVMTKGKSAPRTVKLARKQIVVKAVTSKMLDNNYAYLRISQFNSDAAGLVKRNLENLMQKNKINGLVIDLRNNPGGLLDSAVEISDLFLDTNQTSENKKIVYTKGRVPNADMSFEATPGDILNGAPIVVLINQGSASASEIVAGALQDHHRALVVGQKSFGKGSVQTLIPLDDKTAIKMTTALYYTPSGRSIQASGIKPDITINDLKFSNSEDDRTKIISGLLSEKNLAGHLKNAQLDETAQTNVKNIQDDKLATTDYSLYEAINILKTLSLMKSKGN